MDSTPGSSEVLNPLTPMALLEPKLANQNMISTYVYVGSLSIGIEYPKVLLWDVLSNLRKDLPLVFRLPVRFPGIVFGLSRLSALVFMFCAAIFQTAAIDIPCKRYGMIVDWLFAVVVPMTSLLFLIRIYAIFSGNKHVRVFFTVMWLAVFAGSPGLGLTAANIGPTKYCKQVKVEPYVGAGAGVLLVNDTLVFLAISWKLMKNAHLELHPLRKTGFRAFFRGDYLPSFSRGLLQDGQVYYLTTVTTNLLTVIVFTFTFLPPVFRAMFAVPNTVLMNMMACHVYRRTKLGRFRNLKSPSGNPVSTGNDAAIIPLALAPNRNDRSNAKRLGQAKDEAFCSIEITKTVEQYSNDHFGDKKNRRDSKDAAHSPIV